MKKSNMFVGITLFIVGLLMLVNPEWWMKAVIAILGIEAVANGIYNLVSVRKLVPDTSFQYTIICRGMLSIVIGLIAFFFPFLIEGILRAIFCLLAIYLIVGAMLEMFALGKIREAGTDRRQFVIESGISVVAAIIFFIILSKPDTFIRIGGVIVIIAGLLFILVAWNERPLVQEPVEVVDDISGTIEKSDGRQ